MRKPRELAGNFTDYELRMTTEESPSIGQNPEPRTYHSLARYMLTRRSDSQGQENEIPAWSKGLTTAHHSPTHRAWRLPVAPGTVDTPYLCL